MVMCEWANGPTTTAVKRIRGRTIACLVLGATLAPGSAATVAEVPDLIPSDEPGRSAPIWRSAASLAGEKGEIRLDLFSVRELEDLQRRRAYSAGLDCVRKGILITESERFQSLGVSLSYSEAVYSGTILGFKEGMFNSFTGSLYEIRVEEVLLPREPAQIPERLFVFYPIARFSVGAETFCGGSMRLKERPRVGGGMLVFSVKLAENEDVIQPADSGLFFDAEDGHLSLPVHPDLEGLRSLPLSHIEEQVRKAVREAAGVTEGGDHE